MRTQVCKDRSKQINFLYRTGYTYAEIASKLNLSLDQIHYLRRSSKSLKKRKLYVKNYRSGIKSPKPPTLYRVLYQKIYKFQTRNDENRTHRFTIQDVINKFGLNPVCYLTGRPIDYFNGANYHLDHIIPVSAGGLNSLENLQLASSEANSSKGPLSVDQFISLCHEVALKHPRI